MSNTIEALPWLQQHWEQLTAYITQFRVPQALMVVGKKGLGKHLLVEHFSQALLCNNSTGEIGFCGHCYSCKLFKANTHPDYICIAPEEQGKAIGIDVIRQLTSKLVLKPQFESYRVVVVNTADALNNASANAFLKYLEEPTERTCLILVTDKPSKLPATIRSRCQKVNITISDNKNSQQWLEQQAVTENVNLLLNLAKGAPLLAKQFADNGVIAVRGANFEQWLQVANAKKSFISVAEQWSKLDKQAMDMLMSWVIGWVIDVIKIKSDPQITNLLNVDLLTDLQQLAERLDLKQLYKHYDFLLVSQQRLDTQINKQLLFEEVLIQCSKLKNG